MRRDEEHFAYAVVYHDSTNAERSVGLALAAQPEYRRFRSLSRSLARHNDPPFVVVKNERRDTQTNWTDLLNYVKAEGKKDASVQRYKGLGEMDADQLAETTMEPGRRVLRRIKLADAAEADTVFELLMGIDVAPRKEFLVGSSGLLDRARIDT